MRELLPRLAERKLAGLILKPRFMDEVPQELIRQADELGFPLILVPNETPFSSLLNAILTEIVHHQTALLRRSEEIHRKLIDLVLRGEGLEAVARTLTALLNLPALITDDQFHILADGAGAAGGEDDFTAFIRKLQTEGLYPAGGEPIRRSILSESQLSSVLIYPVRVGAEVTGYICVWERDGDLKEWDRLCVEQGALVTALELQKQEAVRETERRFYNEFLRDLLSGRVASREEAFARASVYGWDLTRPRVLCLFHLDSLDGHEISLDVRRRCQKRIERAMYYALEESHSTHLLSHLGNTSVLLMVPRWHDAARAKEEALHVAHRVLEEMKHASEAQCFAVHVGISRLHEDVLHLSTAYRQAREALAIGMQLTEKQSVTHFDDLGSFRIIFRISDLDELERYCQEHIGALMEYDAQHGTDLLSTLRAVIAADGNLNRASELLSVHYNTLRYRIRRIEEIQGIKVDSWSMLAAVDVALKGLRVLKARKAGSLG